MAKLGSRSCYSTRQKKMCVRVCLGFAIFFYGNEVGVGDLISTERNEKEINLGLVKVY